MTSYLNTINGQSVGSDQSMASINPATGEVPGIDKIMFTGSGRTGARIAEAATRIQAGTVWINQHAMVHPMVPFDGIKGSGYGVEFGVEGLKAVTRPQVISIKN